MLGASLGEVTRACQQCLMGAVGRCEPWECGVGAAAQPAGPGEGPLEEAMFEIPRWR